MAAEPTPPDEGTRSSALADVAPVSWAVMELAHAQRIAATQRLATLGLFPGQELVLAQLWSAEAGDGRSQKDLCSALGLDHSTVAKSVQRLEKAGLVHRSRSAVDGRVTIVRLTDAGRALRDPVHEIWSELEARWAMLGPEDAERFAEIVRAARDQTVSRESRT